MKRFWTGFTLIELLIVVAIIGILAAIAVPNFLNAQIRAKIARAHSDQRSFAEALEMYYLDNNAYPWTDTLPRGANPLELRWIPLTTPVAYISGVPDDPFGDKDTPNGLSWVEQTNGTWKYRTYDLWCAKPGMSHWGWLSQAIETLNLPDSVRYYYASQGPDGKPEADFGSMVGTPYEASNGLNSRGDIFCAGPGMIKRQQ
ncbi:MAG: hypothetical protein DRI92_05915 [Aquificota bacterium]|nr:MAG: hypothetical protein DRI92_05915 [Aquificota bacterium]